MKLFAKKSLGQHFLNSPKVISDIINAGNIQKGESVLEIGPGTGILTRALLNSGAKVIAVEKDDRAIHILNDSFSEKIKSGSLTLINGDILEIRQRAQQNNGELTELDLRNISKSSEYEVLPYKNGDFALIANIPYYITGAILESFLEHEPRPNRAVLLVQKEVADRIVARDGKESILSISVKSFGTPKIISKVPKGAFIPPPNVDSAVISIENISDKRFSESKIDIRMFFDILKASFAHKRKFCAKNLESLLSKELITKIWSEVGLDPKIRAEDIALDQWFEIIGRT